MFQFRRFPTHTYFIQYALPEVCSGGFPHSDIPGSQLICSSPRLFAAYHVLLRLLMPRHSPCALIRLTCRRSKRRSFRFRPHLSVRPKTPYRFVASPLQSKPASLGSNLVWVTAESLFKGSLKSPIGDFNQPSKEGVIFQVASEKRYTL